MFFCYYLDTMLIITLEVLPGRDPSPCLLDGKFAVIQGVEFIMLIIIQEAQHGKGRIQKDCNIFNIGKVNDSMSFNKETKGFFILR